MKEQSTEWRNDVCFLEEEEREIPFKVIIGYCGREYLFEQRKVLTEMFRVALQNKHWVNDADNRSDAFWELVELIRLIEACYLLFAANNSGTKAAPFNVLH